jgi:neutral trehalase
MGWAGGSEMAANIWALFRGCVAKNQRKRLAKKLIKIF